MKLHPRALLVQKARNDLSTAICDVWQRDGLTAVELCSILAQLSAEYSKYPLREERHPDDPNRKADEA